MTLRHRTTTILWTLLWVGALATMGTAQGSLYAIDPGTGDGSSNLYRVDTPRTSPTATPVGETGRIFLDLAIHPLTGVGYALDTASPYDLYRIDLSTAATTLVGPTGLTQPNALEALPCGTLLSWSAVDSVLYEVDPNTAVATALFDTTLFSAGDLALDVDGIVWAAEAGGDRLIRVDLLKSQSVPVGAFGVGPIVGLECDAAGNLFGTQPSLNGRPPVFFAIDKITGAATMIGALQNDGGLDVSGLAYEGSPELILRPDPGFAPPGTPLRFLTDGGEPSNVAFLYTFAVNGAPFLFKVVGGQFGSDCNWTWTINVPPGLSGLDVDFFSVGFSATGNLAVSNIALVQF